MTRCSCSGFATASLWGRQVNKACGGSRCVYRKSWSTSLAALLTLAILLLSSGPAAAGNSEWQGRWHPRDISRYRHSSRADSTASQEAIRGDSGDSAWQQPGPEYRDAQGDWRAPESRHHSWSEPAPAHDSGSNAQAAPPSNSSQERQDSGSSPAPVNYSPPPSSDRHESWNSAPSSQDQGSSGPSEGAGPSPSTLNSNGNPRFQPDDAVWPTTSSHRCVGEEYSTRTCHFKNILYDIGKRAFVYYAGKNPTTDLGEIYHMHWGPNTSMLVLHENLPARQDVPCDEVEPIFLQNAFNPHSFGHMVRDTFHMMTANLMALGREQITHVLVINRILGPNEDNIGYKLGTLRIYQKYSEWIANGAHYLRDITLPCGTHSLFRDVVFGSLMFEVHRDMNSWIVPDWWGGCNSSVFLVQRNNAYRLANIPVPHAADQPRLRVVFGDKSVVDSRRVVNVAELIPVLQRRFPSLEFDSLTLSFLPAREQLVEMSRTAIFISPHASSSFRMAYLPTGGHAIIIGPPEIGHTATESFSEIDGCWDHLSYMRVDRYHVTEPSEVEERFQRKYVPNKDYYRWFDSDSRLQAQKLGDLIESAVNAIRNAKQNS